MPGLPEIEALRQLLEPRIQGNRILRVQILESRLTRPIPADSIQQSLEGFTIQSLGRRAKYLVLDIRNREKSPRKLLLHLGMTGRLWIGTTGDPLPKAAGVVVDFGQNQLVFEDVRKFGRVSLDPSLLEGLGPEPLDPGFSVAALSEALGTSRQAVKVRLMDPSRVVGIGNIYASEALHRARISPARPALALRTAEVAALHAAIQETLSSAIQNNLRAAAAGHSLFYNLLAGSPEGTKVESPAVFQVYDRLGQPCNRCQQEIRRTVQGGRSTYFCAGCQP